MGHLNYLYFKLVSFMEFSWDLVEGNIEIRLENYASLDFVLV